MESSSSRLKKVITVNELIQNHSKKVEAIKQALRDARTVNDELPLLKELTDEIRVLRELRDRRSWENIRS
jgi:hypothetical protein